MQALNGAYLGSLGINSSSPLSELKHSIIDQLCLPAWHMQFLCGEVQLEDEHTFNELVGEATSPAAVDLTAVFDSERILLEVRLEQELYRTWQAMAQLEVVREFETLLDHQRSLRNHKEENEKEISTLELHIQIESLSLVEDKACWKRLQELKQLQRKLDQQQRSLDQQDRDIRQRYTLPTLRDEQRKLNKLKGRARELISELQGMKPLGNNSTWLWLKSSNGFFHGCDLFTMPDVCYGPDPTYYYYSFGPQGPSLHSTEDLYGERWYEDDFLEHYLVEAEDDDSEDDYVPEKVVHFKLSKARREFKGWDRAAH